MGLKIVVRRFASAALLCACALSHPRSAHAGGLEYAGQGSHSLARGGAVTARAADPMTLAHNPAGLAELRGNQMLLDLNIATLNACVDPIGFYGWGSYLGGSPSRLPDPETGEYEQIQLGVIDRTGPMPVAVANDYYFDPYDTVCLDQNVTPVPQLAFTARLSDRVGVGFGLIFPAVQPSGAWGADGTGVIRGDTGNLRPAATRYQLLMANNLGVFPNAGIGVKLAEWLRIGAAVEYGFIAVDTTAMAPATGGTSPFNDIITHVEAFDYFVPAATASLHVVPLDAIDVVFAFRWQDKIDAKGLAEFTSGVFNPTKEVNTSRIDVLSVQQNMPWKLRGGIRYASRRVPRTTSAATEVDENGYRVIHDPLSDERWDVELDVEYQMNGRNHEQFLDFVDGSRIYFKPEGDAMVPNDITIQKRWKDQVSVRLGGTANVIPGVLGISAGAHYENRGIDPGYMQVDFWPLERVGLHTGVTLRLSRSIDINFSYAHIFQETLVVAPPPHALRGDIYRPYMEGGYDNNLIRANDKTVGVPFDRFTPVGMNGQVILEEQPISNPDGVAALAQNTNTTSMDQPPVITNAGRYRSSFDIIAIGANFHF
jgi:hypothetical protein